MKKYFCIMNFIMILLCLSSCNKHSSNVVSENPADANYESREIDLGKNFCTPHDAEEQPLYVIKCDKTSINRQKNAEQTSVSTAYKNGAFYGLDDNYSNGKSTYTFWKVSASDSTEKEVPQGSWSIPQGAVIGMDVLNEDRYVFWLMGIDKEKNSRYYYAVYTDKDGNEVRNRELTRILSDEGIWEKGGYGDICADDFGNIYVWDRNLGKLIMINENDEKAGEYTYTVDKFDNVLECIHTSGGEVLFACGSKEALEFIYFDHEDNTMKKPAKTTLPYLKKFLGLEGNLIYYVADKSLMSWNVESGQVLTLINLKDYEINDISGMSLGQMDSGNISICVKEDDIRYRYELADQKPVASDAISLVNMTEENTYLKGRIFSFGRENPLYSIESTNISDEDAKNRTLMEFATGKGSDILYLSRADFEKVKNQNTLADLGSILGSDTIAIMLPGAVEMGNHNGEILGLPLTVNIHTMVASKEYWQKDSWNVWDVLELLDKNKNLQGLFVDMPGNVSYEYNMMYLIGMDVMDTPFCTEKEARYDTDEFKRILKAVKGITTETNLSQSWDVIQNGEYLGKRFIIYSPWSFCELYGDTLGNNAIMPGFPTDSGRGNYLETGGIIAVNKKSVDKEGLRDFIRYLFSADSQQRIELGGISVRTDMQDHQIEYRDNLEEYVWHIPGGNDYILYGGMDYIRDYQKFIESAVPWPVVSDDIFEMIMEESNSYFYSDKNVDDVAKAIQNRVQLYLNEQ